MTGAQGFQYGTKLYLIGLGTAIIAVTPILGIISGYNAPSMFMNLFVGATMLGLGLVSRVK